MIEVSVKVSNSELSLTEKYLEYQAFSLSKDDPKLSKMVEDTVKKFKGDVEDIRIVAKMNSW